MDMSHFVMKPFICSLGEKIAMVLLYKDLEFS